MSGVAVRCGSSSRRHKFQFVGGISVQGRTPCDFMKAPLEFVAGGGGCHL